MRIRRGAVAGLALALSVTGCSGAGHRRGPSPRPARSASGSPAPTPASLSVAGAVVTKAQVAALIAQRDAAVQHRDLTAFLATVDPHDSSLVAQQRVEFANLTTLPFRSYSLTSKTVSPPTSAGSGQWFSGEGTYVETASFAPDAMPTAVASGYQVTVIDHRLLITSDADTQPWALTPLTALVDGGSVLLIDRRDHEQASVVAHGIGSAVTADSPVWAAMWRHHFLIFATSDQDLFNRQWFGGGRIGDFEGYVFDERHGSGSGHEPRVVLNLIDGLAESPELSHLLRHELTHAATSQVSRGATATWVTEGFAEYVSRRPVSHPPSGAAAALPPGRDDAGPDAFYGDHIDRNYVTALSAFLFIEHRAGPLAARRFFVAAQGAAAHMDRAFSVLGLTQASFVQQWDAWQRDQG